VICHLVKWVTHLKVPVISNICLPESVCKDAFLVEMLGGTIVPIVPIVPVQTVPVYREIHHVMDSLV